MGMMLLIHITAGGMAIVAGFVALFAAKGARLHRRSGMLFVASMVVMGGSGALIAAVRGIEGSVIGGVLAAYLVVTALTTVRPPAAGARWVEGGGVLVALAAGVATVMQGLLALRAGGTLDGVPAPMLFLFGAVALGAAAGDVRVMRAGGIRGTRRLTRHLWRMCFALWVATGSFFLGQADEFPERLRIFPLLAIPAFAPLVVMLFWLWRVRKKPVPRGAGRVRAPAPEPRLVLQSAASER